MVDEEEDARQLGLYSTLLSSVIWVAEAETLEADHRLVDLEVASAADLAEEVLEEAEPLEAGKSGDIFKKENAIHSLFL